MRVLLSLLLMLSALAAAQSLDVRGELPQGAGLVRYRIRRLPVNAFPELPARVADELEARACLIPQSYQAHGPENVIHGSFERAGSKDWAVLCEAHGTVALLVFFASNPAEPMTLAAAPETERLQRHDASGELGFDWGIDAATPEQVHVAQAGMERRPARPDHDALSDTLIDHRTIYHFFTRNAWQVLPVSE